MSYQDLVPRWPRSPLDDRPAIKDQAAQEPHTQNRQPNLGDRENEVFGALRTWPDEIAVPYSVFLGPFESRARAFNLTQGSATAVDFELGGEALEEIKYDDANVSTAQVIQPGEPLPPLIFLTRNHRAIDRYELEPHPQTPSSPVFTPWFESAGEGHDFDVNLGAPAIGIRSGNDVTIALFLVFIEWQRLDANGDPTGPIFEIQFERSDATLETRIFTESIFAFDDTGPPGKIRARLADRQVLGPQGDLTTNKFWHSFVTRAVVTRNAPVDSTIGIVLLRSAHGNKNLDDPISAIVRRNLNATIADDGVITDGIQFTQVLTDVLFHIATSPKHAAIPREFVDNVALGELRAKLIAVGDTSDNALCNLALEDFLSPAGELEMVGQLGRIIPTRHGEFLTFYRDEAQDTATLINNRSKAAFEATVFEFDAQLAPDAVEVEYLSIDQGYTTQTLFYPEDSLRTNVRRMKLPGGNREQALRRARFEYLRQIFTTDRTSVAARREGNFLRILRRVALADELLSSAFSGEARVMGPRLLVADRDPSVSVVNQGLVLRARDGASVQEFRIVGQFGRTLELDRDIALELPAPESTLGLLFAITGSAGLGLQSWIVNGLTRTKAGAQIDLSPYDPEIYRIADQNPIAEDIFTRHEPWLVQYTSDLYVTPGDPLPPLSARGLELPTVGVNPTIVSTGGLLDAGLGARRVDAAVHSGFGAAGGFAAEPEGPNTLSDSRALWTRVLFRPTSAAPVGDVLELATIQPVVRGATLLGIDGPNIRIRWADDEAALPDSDYQYTVVINEWTLLDILQDPITGRMRVLRNGLVQESSQIDPGRRIPGPLAQLGILANRTGSVPSQEYDLSWAGWQHVPNVDFLTRDQHVLDVEALGLPLLPENVITRHEPWLAQWTADSVQAARQSWIPLTVDAGAPLQQRANPADFGQSTAPMSATGLGSRRVNKAIRNPGNAAFFNDGSDPVESGILAFDILWIRIVVKQPLQTGTVLHLVDQRNGAPFDRIQWEGRTLGTLERIAWRDQVHGDELWERPRVNPGTWLLSDLVINPTTGVIQWYENGVLYDSGSAFTPNKSLPWGDLDLGCTATRTGSAPQGDTWVSWWGYQTLDADTDFTLAIHTQDAIDLGVIPPP